MLVCWDGNPHSPSLVNAGLDMDLDASHADWSFGDGSESRGAESGNMSDGDGPSRLSGPKLGFMALALASSYGRKPYRRCDEDVMKMDRVHLVPDITGDNVLLNHIDATPGKFF